MYYWTWAIMWRAYHRRSQCWLHMNSNRVTVRQYMIATSVISLPWLIVLDSRDDEECPSFTDHLWSDQHSTASTVAAIAYTYQRYVARVDWVQDAKLRHTQEVSHAYTRSDLACALIIMMTIIESQWQLASLPSLILPMYVSVAINESNKFRPAYSICCWKINHGKQQSVIHP